MMVPEERRSVTALLVSPQQYGMVVGAVGGHWRDTGVALESRYEPRSLLLLLRDLKDQEYRIISPIRAQPVKSDFNFATALC
jgi:hypothetical protein